MRTLSVVMLVALAAAPTVDAQPASMLALEGQVRDEQGAPLERATIAIRFGSRIVRLTNISTDAEGRFRIPVTGGAVALAAWAEDHETVSLTFTQVPASAVQIVLRRAIPVRGMVVDQSGAPVAGARVELVPQAAPGLNHVLQARTRRDGSYSVENAGQTRRYRLQVTAPGCAARPLRTMTGRAHADSGPRTDVVPPCR